MGTVTEFRRQQLVYFLRDLKIREQQIIGKLITRQVVLLRSSFEE